MQVELGTVVCPSGVLLIVDPGYLKMWSHDAPPTLPDGVLSDAESTARANEAVDLQIVGRDAETVGRLFDRSWHPLFIYDIPRDAVAELERDVAELANARRLDARVEILPERVSHRRRIERAVERGHGAGEISFHGIWAAAVGDLPVHPIPVVGELMPEGGPDEKRLRRVTLVARDGAVARSEPFAHVGVDWARLVAVDADAVRHWRDDASLDGLADLAFWGRDAQRVAARVQAEALDERTFGWRNLPVEQAIERGTALARLKETERLQCAADFRPHNHQFMLMEQVRASSSESGVVTLGTARACGFTTRWGDGIFEVFRDLDADGRLLRVRIELGTEERQRLMRRLELRWFTSALVSRKVLDEKLPVRFMYRETPDHEGDSGWRMMSGFEDPGYDAHPAKLAVVRASDFATMDRRVDALLDEPVGSVFERVPGEEEFKRVTDWTPTRA